MIIIVSKSCHIQCILHSAPEPLKIYIDQIFFGKKVMFIYPYNFRCFCVEKFDICLSVQFFVPDWNIKKEYLIEFQEKSFAAAQNLQECIFKKKCNFLHLFISLKNTQTISEKRIKKTRNK